MIHYMNDAVEFQHALNVARELLTEIDATTSKERCEEFLSVLSGVAIFVFSLTIHGDQLSQWRAYAASGGYALAFEFDHLQRIADANNARLVKCDYDLSSQRERLRPIVNELLEAAAMSKVWHGIALHDDFGARFSEVAAAIKHPSFREEDEWRLVSTLPSEPSKVGYRAAAGLLVPYCQWSLRVGSAYPISSIVVGPTIASELASRSLHYLTTSAFGWPVRVEFSDSPLRPLR
jgi:hypothetical protein